MDTTTNFIVSGMIDWPVDLVLYDDGQTRLIKARIESPSPLRVIVERDKNTGIRAARRVMLLANHDDLIMRADGHLDQVRRGSEGLHLEISQVHWELLERRRHVRVSVSIPISLRTVVENETAPTVEILYGTTVDISISGAYVQMSPAPAEGSLVEFQADLGDEAIRVLAVVAHSTGETSGIGLHFVEYIDNARLTLHEFLSNAA